MRERWIVFGLVALWAALMATGFVLFQTTEPTGSGFTRGLNRLEVLLRWLGLAAVAAVAAWAAGRAVRLDGPWLVRNAGRVPGFVMLAMVAAFALTVAAVAVWDRTGGETPPAPAGPSTIAPEVDTPPPAD